MRTFLRFLKPYQGLCLLTLLVMALDVDVYKRQPLWV